MKTIGIIGGGNMGEAILSGVVGHYHVLVCEKEHSRQSYLKRKYKIASSTLRVLLRKSDVIILAVKPQDFDSILNEMKDGVLAKHLIISIAAGISTNYIEASLKKKVRVIRTMPNLLALIGQSVTAVCRGKYGTKNDLTLACKIFNHIGQTVVVKEGLINSVTAVSGSGPAYLFLFIECLIKAGEKIGLNEALACQLVLDTLKGSINLLQQQKADPAQLRARVTSKGGTTQAAIEVFQKNNFEKIILQAIQAARKRARALTRAR